MSSRIYLSGPSGEGDSSIPISADWKAYAASTFLQSGIIVSNPIDLDLTGFIDEKDAEVHNSSVKHSLELIDKSDSLLANVCDKSDATNMEMFYAHRQGKRVVVVGNEPFSPWILSHSEVRFRKLKEALEYLVSQPSTLDTISWASQFENEIIKRAEQYPPAGELDYEYYGGSQPVLVIAPHATASFKDGVMSRSESYTGSMAVLLHKLTGCHSLTSSYCTVADPVYYSNSPFTKFLADILKKIQVKLVIFLHGIEDWNYKVDVNLDNWNGTSLHKVEYMNLLASMLRIKEIKEISFEPFDSKLLEQMTIYKMVNDDLGVPVMKIDIHKRFRLPQMHPSHFSKLSTSLAQFIMMV